jgi:hypothetical protein
MLVNPPRLLPQLEMSRRLHGKERDACVSFQKRERFFVADLLNECGASGPCEIAWQECYVPVAISAMRLFWFL